MGAIINNVDNLRNIFTDLHSKNSRVISTFGDILNQYNSYMFGFDSWCIIMGFNETFSIKRYNSSLLK